MFATLAATTFAATLATRSSIPTVETHASIPTVEIAPNVHLPFLTMGLVSSRERAALLFFSQLVEWFAANPQFEQSLVRVLSRAGVLFAFVDAVALELENGCAQYQADAWGGGGLAGVAQ